MKSLYLQPNLQIATIFKLQHKTLAPICCSLMTTRANLKIMTHLMVTSLICISGHIKICLLILESVINTMGFCLLNENPVY